MDKWDRKDLSPALLLAQQKLNSLRDQHRAQEPLSSLRSANDGRMTRPRPLDPDRPRQLPDHLGWGSVPLTKAIRKVQGQQKQFSPAKCAGDPASLATAPRLAPPPEPIGQPSSNKTEIKLYPDLALGILREKFVAVGRIWLLLQQIDSSGQGWLKMSSAREQLTKKNGAYQVCGRRQLRKLLARGDGLFWTRIQDRIWLRSTAKVAAALGVSRLRGRPVALPIAILLKGIGTVRAHFYASFHSGRRKKSSDRLGGTGSHTPADPLSRATLQALSAVKPRTQRHYEKRAKVQSQPNYVVTRQANTEDIQEQAWQRGRAWFRFTDHTGRFGKKGEIYSAWQLPNSYSGPHEQQPIGRQKRINRELADLFMEGMTGNGKVFDGEDTPYPKKHVRRYHGSGSAAAMSYNRQPDGDAFWRSRRQHPGNYEMWLYLPGQGSL